MSGQNNDHSNNFWQGFAFGAASLAGIAYIIGTKPGREKLKSIIEFMEKYQGNADSLFEAIDTFLAENKSDKNSGIEPAEAKADLNALIDKVKSITKS